MAEYRTWVKWVLFFSAYAPLWLLIAYDTLDIRLNIAGVPVPVATLFFLLLSGGSFQALRSSINVRKTREPKQRVVSDYTSRDELLSSYLIAYIIPFVNLDYSSLSSWFTLIVFLSVLATIQMGSEQLYVNPLLAAMGYRIYEVEYESHETTLVVVHNNVNIQQQESLRVTEISRGIYLSTK